MKQLDKFLDNIRFKFSSKVKGKVSVVYDVKNDYANFVVFNREYGLSINIGWDNISKEFMSSGDTELIARELVRIYKVKLFSTFICS